MAEKALGAALRSPRRQLDSSAEVRPEEEQEFAGSIERELRALIAQHGPDPDRIVALLGGRKSWERRRAAMILAADYGSEAAEVLIRSAQNRAIFDDTNPIVVQLRGAARKGRRGHGQLLADAVKKRAAGKRTALPKQARERGRPLPLEIAQALERTVGESASDIRVVTGPEAGAAAAAVGAIALTTDRTIFLADQQFSPETIEGRELLAHEAAHALQQRAGGDGAGLASPAAEQEADRVAAHVVGPASVGAAPLPLVSRIGDQAVARKAPEPGVSAAATAQVKITFVLGPATVIVDLEAKAAASVGSGGASASASASAVTTVKLDTSKLNPLLPKGVRFTEPNIDIQIKGTKLAAAIVFKAEYEGKEPYLKKVPFSIKCDTAGQLSAKLKLDMQIPGFCKAKSDEIKIDKSGITGDISITPNDITIKGVGGGAAAGLSISGSLMAHIKDNQLDSIDGDASVVLPQGFGNAKLTAKIDGGSLSEVTADVKSRAIPGLGVVEAKMKWSEAAGFELKDLQVPIKEIPGLEGSVKVSFKGGKFTAEAKSLKFKAKALDKVTFENVKISEAGLDGTAKLAGINLDVPGWLKVSGLKGSITLKGGAVSAKDVSAAIEVAGGKAKGTLSISYVNGDLSAKGKITKLDIAPKILKLGAGGLSFDVDLGGSGGGFMGLGGGGGGTSVVGEIGLSIGKWATGKISKLGFSNGYFTGSAKLPFTAGALKGIDIDVELLASSPWIKAKVDAKNLVGKKLPLPFKGSLPVDVTCTKAELSFSGDLSDLSGSVGGTVKVDGGKLAEGTFDLKAADGSIEGDLTIKVKQIPGLKVKGGDFKIHVKDDKITGGGKVGLEFDKYIKGTVWVSYDTAKGFSVEGKGLTVDIPNFPFDVKPFDVSYKDGKFEVKGVVGTLKPGKIPGVATATITLDFVDNKLKAELKNVTFTVPQLKKTTLSAKWDDGKWEVKGESELTLPKGLKAIAKFGANNGQGGELNFNCELEVSTTELKKLFPGVEIKSGKVTLKYENGKLTMANAELGLLIANGVLDGTVTLSLNEDKTFNGSGKFALKMKFIKAKEIEVKVENSVLKRVAVTGLELDLPKGKGSLTGDASLDNGKFNCNLTAKVTDVPWVQQASATVGITDGKWTKFEASGTFKKTPGIDLSGVTVGGKLEGGSPAFWADGKVPIKGLKDPLEFHFYIGAGKWEIRLKGSFEIKGVGKATIDADLKNDGFRVDIAIAPSNTKVVKAASGWVAYSGGNLTFGGSLTVAVAKDFEGTVKFEKTGDGDFEFMGKITPTKAQTGTPGKRPLITKAITPPGLSVPYGIPGFADIHVGAGVKGSFEAGLIGPSFNFISASVSGKLSDLEKGELPDAEIKVKPEVGAYAAATLGARVFVGASLLGASLDLSAEAEGKIEAKAVISSLITLIKEGNSYKFKADLNAELGAALSIVLALRLILAFVGAELWSTTLGSKELALGSFNMGQFPLKSFEYTFGGPKKDPPKDQVEAPMPEPKKIQDAGLELGKQKVAEAKDAAVKKIKESTAYKVAHGLYEGAKKVWNFVTSW